jgi:hypothetical protein
MKYFILLLFPLVVISQEKAKIFNEINVGYQSLFQLEDSFFKQGYEHRFGLSGELELVTYKNFGFISGLQFDTFKVINTSIAGNITSASQRTVYFKLLYHYELVKNLSVHPLLGLGLTRINEVGVTNGTAVLVGSNLTYNFYRDVSLFCGIQFSTFNYNVITAPAEIDIFDTSSHFQLNLGLNFKCYVGYYNSIYRKTSNDEGIIKFNMFQPIEAQDIYFEESTEYLPVCIGYLGSSNFTGLDWDLGNLILFKSEEIIPFTLFLNASSTNKIIEIIEVNAIKYESRINFFIEEFYYESQMIYELKKNQNFEVFYQIKNLNTNEIETFTVQLTIEEDPIEYTITY